jgi:putative ABC transport system permease protein
VGAAGAAAGCLLGLAEAPQLASWIVRQGLAPSWFSVQFTAGSAAALAVAFVAGVAVAVLSVLVAAARAGMIRPAEALREAAVEPERIGRLRLVAGMILLVCVLAYEPRETALNLQSPIPLVFPAMGIDRPSFCAEPHSDGGFAHRP